MIVADRDASMARIVADRSPAQRRLLTCLTRPDLTRRARLHTARTSRGYSPVSDSAYGPTDKTRARLHRAVASPVLRRGRSRFGVCPDGTALIYTPPVAIAVAPSSPFHRQHFQLTARPGTWSQTDLITAQMVARPPVSTTAKLNAGLSTNSRRGGRMPAPVNASGHTDAWETALPLRRRSETGDARARD